ncbi:hypothetical protein QR680_013733 [Steinernema hermaphroditum]|uniref:Chitin-binding type-2 domain-containing protein n=1 Tax=Steinernema hermaphroditum TaxID=289476 RepID=A0AA39I6G9_9BILA|nr:hypothetical protein QR680_013733 [Steinernema hermaphroditum]
MKLILLLLLCASAFGRFDRLSYRKSVNRVHFLPPPEDIYDHCAESMDPTDCYYRYHFKNGLQRNYYALKECVAQTGDERFCAEFVKIDRQ